MPSFARMALWGLTILALALLADLCLLTALK